MAISLQPRNKAELHVEIGKTSVEDLQKFQDQVSAKGGGEIRAKKNSDGSFTLYAAADKKLRLSAFSSSYGAEARAGKQSLAKELMKDIISRRLPADKKGAPNLAGRNLLQKISGEGGNHTRELGAALKEVSQLSYSVVPKGAKDHYGQLDTILTTPGLRKAFGESMKSQFSGENFDFLCKVKDFSKLTNPHEKLKLAEEIFKMIESPENPPTVGFGAGKGPVQVNLSSANAGKIYEDLQHLRTAIKAGKEPLPGDKDMLNHLFSDGEHEIQRLVSENNLAKFVGSDGFKAEAGSAYARTVFGEREGNPASYLRPGSGEEFRGAVLDKKDHFSKLENTLQDPGMRSAFREHLGSVKQTDRLDHYESLEALTTLADEHGMSDAALLEQAEQLLRSQSKAVQGGDAPRVGGELSLDDGVQNHEEDPHLAKAMEDLGKLKKALQNREELFGETVQGRRDQESLFGPSSDVQARGLIHKEIKSFLETMKADVANGLRFDGFQSFKQEKLGGIIERQVGEKMFSEQLDWRPDATKPFSSWDRFAGKALEGSGGATGSGRTKVGKQFFQVKGSIEHSGFLRRRKAGGLNTENYGEVIASNLGKALVGPRDRHLVPEVALRQDGNSHEAMVTSKYLAGGKGDLKGLYTELAGPLPKGQKHPKIHLDSPGLSGDGILRLDGAASRDVQRNIALSALLGDHDVNPGNMIAVKDGRVGRIDFGHAFNELINGPGGKATGGGGVRNKENRILDFFNRETVSGVPFTGQSKAKLWRDYTGAGPSEGMTSALRSVASSTEESLTAGLLQAKSQFADLIEGLQKEDTQAARDQIKDLTKSLARISKNIEKPITAEEPLAIVDQVFENLEAFVKEGQAQMRDVADLSELQTRIDQHILASRDNPQAPVPQDISQGFNTLTGKSVKTEDGAGLNWMKMTAGVPAFKGDLGAYIQTRRAELEQLQ